MLISERGFIRNLNRACRTEGYIVGVSESGLHISTSNWYMEYNMDKVPHKILATLVEHMGFLPQIGSFSSVQKKRSGVVVQEAIPEFVKEQILGWSTPELNKQLVVTQIQCADSSVLQVIDGSYTCFAIPAERLEMITDNLLSQPIQLKEGNKVEWFDGDGCITMNMYQPFSGSRYRKIWDLFESKDLRITSE